MPPITKNHPIKPSIPCLNKPKMEIRATKRTTVNNWVIGLVPVPAFPER